MSRPTLKLLTRQSDATPSDPGSSPHSLGAFLKQHLSPVSVEGLRRRFPTLMAELEGGQISDAQVARRVVKGEEALTWVLHAIVHTRYFLKLLTRRCARSCGSPCRVIRIEKMPCEWSERVLWEFFLSLTPMGGSKPSMEGYLVYAPEGQSLIEWLAYKLHFNFHYKQLADYGFIPPEPSRMPRSIQKLAEKDPSYRLIWIHRWYWGNESLEDPARLLGRDVDDPGFLAMVDEVDEVFLASREVKSLTAKYAGLAQKRLESGIPPRLPSWVGTRRE